MSKVTTSFTLDSELLELAKRRFPHKLSSMVNDFLRVALANDVVSESIEELREKIAEDQRELDVLQERLMANRAKLSRLEAEMMKKVADEKRKVKEQWEQAKLTAERVRRSGLLEEIAE